MTIKHMDKFTEALWDWAILDGCFGSSRIKPTDIDGLVEVNDHFLLIEAKGEHARITKGQQYTFEALQATGRFTIIIINGENNQPYSMQVLYPNGATSQLQQAGVAELRSVVARWYRYARVQHIARAGADALSSVSHSKPCGCVCTCTSSDRRIALR